MSGSPIQELELLMELALVSNFIEITSVRYSYMIFFFPLKIRTRSFHVPLTFLTRNDMQVMEQFFGLVNTFLRNHRDTWKRRLGVRTYKVPLLLFNKGCITLLVDLIKRMNCLLLSYDKILV